MRSLLVGCAVVVLISLGAPHSIWTFGSSEMTWSFFPIGVGFLFVCLIFANALLKTLNFNWALRPAELITVVVMGLVCTGIPVFLIGYFLAIPTTPYYFASAENQWGTYVLPYLPAWLLPSNDGLAMTWFFEGLPIGEPTPWGTLLAAWAMPLFWWLSFIWTLYLVCFCVVVILRKQWVERERLAYPLMEVPQALVANADSSRRLPAVMYSKVFWAGAAIPLCIVLWNIVGFFFHFFPKIEWHHPIQIAHGFPTINIRFYFPVIGFMYFANLNVTFSIWVFFLLTLIEEGLFNRFGLGVTEADKFVWGLPSTSWQCWGAFVVLVLWGLWMARDHLKDVVRKAWNPAHPIDDRRELMSYRAAVLGLLLGVFYMLTWLHEAGMEWSVAMLFLAGVLIAYLGITRLVVQTGVFYLTTPVVSQAMTMMTLGTSAISPTGLAALGLTYSFFGDVQSIFMPSAAHGRQAAKQPAHCPPRFCLGHRLGCGAVLCGLADQSHLHGLRAGSFQLQLLDLPRLLGRRSDGFWRRDGQDQGPSRFPRAKVGLLWHWRGGDVRFDVYAVSLSVVAPAPGGLGHFRDLDGAQPSAGDLRGMGSQKSDHALWRH